MFCGSANGDLLPPFILVPGAKEGVPSTDMIEQHHIPGARYWKMQKGWMTGTCFVKWLEFFNNYLIENKVLKPVLLVLDGLKTHVTIEAAKYVAANGIRMFLLVLFASAMSQPLDIAWMAPAKIWYHTALLQFQTKISNFFCNKKNFPRVLKRMLDIGYKPDTIKNGFKKAGIFPWDPMKPYENEKLYQAKDTMERIKEQKKKLDPGNFKLIDPYAELDPLHGIIKLPNNFPEGTSVLSTSWVIKTIKDGVKSQTVTKITPEALKAIAEQRSSTKVKLFIYMNFGDLWHEKLEKLTPKKF